MGKKNKEKNLLVVPAEKKTSLIDKLKFMNKSKKLEDKSEEKLNSIISKKPIDTST
jgi:hypothetical protein